MKALQDAAWVNSTHQNRHIIDIKVMNGAHTARSAMALVPVAMPDLERCFVYGSYSEKMDEFAGLSLFYDTLDPKRAQNAVNVFDGGSQTDRRTSIWYVVWSPETIYFASSDEGIALVVADWRYASRVANIDPEAIGAEDLDRLITRAICAAPGGYFAGHRGVLYMSEQIRARLPEKLRPADMPETFIRTLPCIRSDEARVV